MAMPLPADLLARGPYFSVDVLPRLPDDGNRYEVVYGELLVSPAPSAWHQELLRRLVKAIDRYREPGHPACRSLPEAPTVSGGRRPDVLARGPREAGGRRLEA
jgi:Uma2 family endonuclease